MRAREKSLHLRLSEKEDRMLRSKAEKAGMKPQAFIRSLVQEREVKEVPPVDFFEVLKNLRKIGNNLNQIAAKANAIGFVDAAEYWKNVRWLQEVVGKMMEVMY